MIHTSCRPACVLAVLATCLVRIGGAADIGEAVSALGSSTRDYDVTFGVEYSTHGQDNEHRLLADIYLPREHGPFPTILMVHGGAWFLGSKADVARHARDVATAGFAVVAINYRLAPYHKFPAQLEDCRSALGWIKENAAMYSFDVKNVAAYGYSAGAHLASLLAVTQNETGSDSVEAPVIKCVVAGGAPCEFSWIDADSERLSYWLGGPRSQKPDVYAAASPVNFVDPNDPPIFFFHGGRDRIVPMGSARQLNRSLDSKGVRTEFHVVEGSSHLGAFLNRQARDRAIDFLNEHLKTAGSAK